MEYVSKILFREMEYSFNLCILLLSGHRCVFVCIFVYIYIYREREIDR